MTKEKQIVCLCMDVTIEDIEMAIKEGYDDLEIFKRYTTCFMGPCQGKQCGINAIKLFCKYTGKDLSSLSPTTSRPPIFPVSLAALAAPERKTEKDQHIS